MRVHSALGQADYRPRRGCLCRETGHRFRVRGVSRRKLPLETGRGRAPSRLSRQSESMQNEFVPAKSMQQLNQIDKQLNQPAKGNENADLHDAFDNPSGF